MWIAFKTAWQGTSQHNTWAQMTFQNKPTFKYEVTSTKEDNDAIFSFYLIVVDRLAFLENFSKLCLNMLIHNAIFFYR